MGSRESTVKLLEAQKYPLTPKKKESYLYRNMVPGDWGTQLGKYRMLALFPSPILSPEFMY